MKLFLTRLISLYFCIGIVFSAGTYVYADEDDSAGFSDTTNITTPFSLVPPSALSMEEKITRLNFDKQDRFQQEDKIKFEWFPHRSFLIGAGLYQIYTLVYTDEDRSRTIRQEIRPFFKITSFHYAGPVNIKNNFEITYRAKKNDDNVTLLKNKVTFTGSSDVGGFYPYIENVFRYELETQKIKNQVRVGLNTKSKLYPKWSKIEHQVRSNVMLSAYYELQSVIDFNKNDTSQMHMVIIEFKVLF